MCIRDRRSASEELALRALDRAVELAEAPHAVAPRRAALNFERRVVMAAAYERVDRAPSAGVHARVDRLARAYRARHAAAHAGEAGGRPLSYYLHISKNAGTTMCHLAHKHATNHVFGWACWEPGDGPTWLMGAPSAVERGCAERAAHMRAERSDMSFVERYMDANGTLCDELVYGVTLRDPLARVVSHVDELFQDTFMVNCSDDADGARPAARRTRILLAPAEGATDGVAAPATGTGLSLIHI